MINNLLALKSRVTLINLNSTNQVKEGNLRARKHAITISLETKPSRVTLMLKLQLLVYNLTRLSHSMKFLKMRSSQLAMILKHFKISRRINNKLFLIKTTTLTYLTIQTLPLPKEGKVVKEQLESGKMSSVLIEVRVLLILKLKRKRCQTQRAKMISLKKLSNQKHHKLKTW